MNKTRVNANCRLAVDLIARGDDRVLAREPVSAADLGPMRDEAWLNGLRAGHLGWRRQELTMRVQPGRSAQDASDRLLDFCLELLQGEQGFRQKFSMLSLAFVAERAKHRLQSQGALQGQECQFVLRTLEAEQAPSPGCRKHPGRRPVVTRRAKGAGPICETGSLSRHLDRSDLLQSPSLESQGALQGQECQFVLRTLEAEQAPSPGCRKHPGRRPVVTRRAKGAGPICETGSLSRHLDRSDLLQSPSLEPKEGDQEDRGLCIFVPPDVWAETHQSARRGGEVESAALWTGRLIKDEESPEIFVVVDACLPAEHAEEKKYSVRFSGETWEHIEGRLQARRQRLGRPAERFIGSVHGHNFPVAADENGQKRCAACFQTTVCGRTNAVISTDDEQWHRSVFSGQPWATLLIFGWNARDEEDWKLYGLKEGRLQPRSLRLLHLKEKKEK